MLRMLRGLLAAGVLVGLATGCPAPWPSLVVEPLGARQVAPRPTLFKGVMVFDAREGMLQGPSDVLVTAGQIREISPEIPPVPGEDVVRGDGRTLLPGLIDAHVHIGLGQGEAAWAPVVGDARAQVAALLYAGVTTAVVASHSEEARLLQREISQGLLPGPKLWRASRMFTSVGGHPGPILEIMLGPAAALVPREHREVRSAADAREQVREEVDDTAPDFVKVAVDACSGTAPPADVLEALIDEAHHLGKPVLVHPGTVENAMLAMRLGADVLMHPPSCGGELTEEQRATLALRHIPVVSTVRVFDVLGRMFEEPLPLTPFERQLMRPGAEKAFEKKGDLSRYPKAPEDFLEQIHRRGDLAGRNVKALADGGAVVLAGTDSGLPGLFHGAALHEELTALVRLGVTPAAALRMATYAPGRVLMPDGALGQIEVGAWADLVLVEGDPTRDIQATRNIAGVWQRGRKVQRR
ncbi:MAG TPA: amidohydrolase family protein [Myxococcales bacterium]|nr:amidohydrolase family protein [Myxococcales bacterium]